MEYTIGLLLCTGGLLALPFARAPIAWLVIAGTVGVSLKTRINPVWLIAVGAAVGAAGLI